MPKFWCKLVAIQILITIHKIDLDVHVHLSWSHLNENMYEQTNL